MIPGFEDQTAPLSDFEKDILMPAIVLGLSKRIGKENAITNAEMCKALRNRFYTHKSNLNIENYKSYYKRINPARIRKVINHIRINDKLSCLVSTSKGYYISTDSNELNTYIKSLNKRATAILAVARAIDRQRNNLNPNLFE